MGDHRLEVRPVAEAGRLAEVADDPRLRDGSRAARVARRDRRPAADLELDVPHLERAGEVGRQLGRRQPRPVELGARLGLLLEAAVDHQRDGLLLGHPVAVDLRVDDRVGDRAQVELPVDEQQRRVVRAVADVHHHLGHVDGPALGEQAAREDRPDERRAAVGVDALEVVARAPPRGCVSSRSIRSLSSRRFDSRCSSRPVVGHRGDREERLLALVERPGRRRASRRRTRAGRPASTGSRAARRRGR